MEVPALLFDTRSIQRYIFSGNRLKTNIGASYIVDQLFEKVLVQEIIKKHRADFGLASVDDTTWKKEAQAKKQGKALTALPADCYVAYIGGGNALLLFKENVQDPRKAIVTAFTKDLLVRYPGLKTGSALGHISLASASAFQASLNVMYGTLKKNQNTLFPEVNVPYTGLTLACEINGEAANFYDDQGLIAKDGTPRFYSQEVRAKTEAATEANNRLKEEFQAEIKGYEFPLEFEQLGQREGESDLAIIHIDGNQMGVRFGRCKSMQARSRLSYQVEEKTKRAFATLLSSIVADIENNQYAGFLQLTSNILPIRPLILGGDDVTFVCPARVAVQYARRFMQALNKPLAELPEVKGISSCAGIAILPTSYPFFRGYTLAEQACDAAKAKSRENSETCWLDFVILHGEQAPELDQIRQEEYHGAQGNMHFGPYQVDGPVKKPKNAALLDRLLACTADFRQMPRNKVKELRFVSQQGRAEVQTYLEQLRHLGLALPTIPGWEDFATTVWQNPTGLAGKGRTPYVDAIEMMDYTIPGLL